MALQGQAFMKLQTLEKCATYFEKARQLLASKGVTSIGLGGFCWGTVYVAATASTAHSIVCRKGWLCVLCDRPTGRCGGQRHIACLSGWALCVSRAFCVSSSVVVL